MEEGTLKVFSGNSNPELAREIAGHLEVPMGQALITTFKNREIRIRILDNVRGCDVFIVQSLCHDTHHHIMELLLMMDAVRRASARRITAVIPYYAYAKQEKKTAGREPISAKLLANLITVAGADRVLTVDLHAADIEGFFDIPVDHLRSASILASYFQRLESGPVVVVSPDAGGVARANQFRQRLSAPLAIIAKQRPQPDLAEVLEMVGDVRGARAIIVDDMISTGGTIIEATRTLLERGAREVYACATHGVFTPEALVEVQRSPLRKVVITNTVPLPVDKRNEKIEVLSVAELLAKSIHHIHHNLSVSSLIE